VRHVRLAGAFPRASACCPRLALSHDRSILFRRQLLQCGLCIPPLWRFSAFSGFLGAPFVFPWQLPRAWTPPAWSPHLHPAIPPSWRTVGCIPAETRRRACSGGFGCRRRGGGQAAFFLLLIMKFARRFKDGLILFRSVGNHAQGEAHAAKIVPTTLFFFGGSGAGTIAPVRRTRGVWPGADARAFRERAVGHKLFALRAANRVRRHFRKPRSPQASLHPTHRRFAGSRRLVRGSGRSATHPAFRRTALVSLLGVLSSAFMTTALIPG